MARPYKGGVIDRASLWDPKNPDPNVLSKEPIPDATKGRAVLFIRLEQSLKDRIIKFAEQEAINMNSATTKLIDLGLKAVSAKKNGKDE